MHQAEIEWGLELYRLITLNAMQYKKKMMHNSRPACAIRLLIGITCFIYVIGFAARSMVLIKEGSNIVQSGLVF